MRIHHLQPRDANKHASNLVARDGQGDPETTPSAKQKIVRDKCFLQIKKINTIYLNAIVKTSCNVMNSIVSCIT